MRNWLHKILPFGWGNVTKLALAYFLSTLYFYIPVGTLYLRSKELSYVQINSLWGIIVFTMFLTEVPTGIIADRLGHKRAINLALGLQALGEVIYVFASGYPGFVLSAIVGGLGFAFGSGCIDAIAYDTLRANGREAEMSKAMGYIEAAQRLANLLAFTCGGLLVRDAIQERFTIAIIATACMVGAGFLVSLSLREPVREHPGERKGSPMDLLVEGIRVWRGNKLFRRLALLSLATVPFRDYLGSLYQPHFVAAGVPVAWFGVALALASGLSVLGARYAYRLEARLGSGMSLLLVTALPGALYVAMARISHPVLAVVLFCALYSSMSLRGPILAGRLNVHIESRNRATVLSLISMLSGLYVAAMGLLVGRITDASVPGAFLFMGVVVLVGSLLFRVQWRQDTRSTAQGEAA